MLNYKALAAATLKGDPFDHLVAPDFLAPEVLARVNQAYPEITSPRNLDPDELHYGAAFQELLDALNDPVFGRAIGGKFGVNLEGLPITITVRKFCEESDGNIHTDHWSKVITVLIYFNEDWTHEGGKLRLLRSRKDIEDYAEEVTPLGGTLLAFRRTPHSYHGHKRFVGERRMIQVNWIRSGRMAQSMQRLARYSTHAAKRLAQLAR